jgi:hypothetical protein
MGPGERQGGRWWPQYQHLQQPSSGPKAMTWLQAKPVLDHRKRQSSAHCHPHPGSSLVPSPSSCQRRCGFSFVFFLIFCPDVEDWPKGLVCVRRALYHLCMALHMNNFHLCSFSPGSFPRPPLMSCQVTPLPCTSNHVTARHQLLPFAFPENSTSSLTLPHVLMIHLQSTAEVQGPLDLYLDNLGVTDST